MQEAEDSEDAEAAHSRTWEQRKTLLHGKLELPEHHPELEEEEEELQEAEDLEKAEADHSEDSEPESHLEQEQSGQGEPCEKDIFAHDPAVAPCRRHIF